MSTRARPLKAGACRHCSNTDLLKNHGGHWRPKLVGSFRCLRLSDEEPKDADITSSLPTIHELPWFAVTRAFSGPDLALAIRLGGTGREDAEKPNNLRERGNSQSNPSKILGAVILIWLTRLIKKEV
jgi:hypothetical protein